MGEYPLNKRNKLDRTAKKGKTVAVESKYKKEAPPRKGVLLTVLLVAALGVVSLFTSGCASSQQYFNEGVLDECSTDDGQLKSGDTTVLYSIAPLTSDAQNVTFRAVENQTIVAACVIPYDAALDNMPESVDEALQVCSDPEKGLLLNVNSTTGAVVWPARSCELYSLYMNVSVPGMIGSSTEQLISHFTLDNGRLVPVNARQIMSWYRGRPSADEESVPAPRPTRRPGRPQRSGAVEAEFNLDEPVEPAPPPPAREPMPTAAAPDRALPASAPRTEVELPTEVNPDDVGGG